METISFLNFMTSIFNGKLPIKLSPQKDELLSSWLCRVAQANAVKLNTLNAIVFPQVKIWNRDIDKCATEEFLELLEMKTGVCFGELRKTRLQEFEGKIYEKHNPKGNTVWIMPVGVFHSVRRQFGLQICPACLAEDKLSYYRKIWRLSFITICQKHYYQLFDECPDCSQPIMFHRNELGSRNKYRIQSLTVCSFCGTDWTKAKIDRGNQYITEIEVTFQQKLLNTINSGWFELSKNNYVHSIPFFKGLAQLVKLLSTSWSGKTLRSSLQNINKLPTIHETANKFSFDLQRVKVRHFSLGSASYLLENWAENFVEICKQNKIWSSPLLHSMKEVPYWYGSVIFENLSRPNRTYTEQEIISILKLLETKDELINLQTIKSLSGSNDIFDFFSYQFSISVFKKIIRHNQRIWNKTRTKRRKIPPQNIHWKYLVTIEKEVFQLQFALQKLISEYELKERLEWVNSYQKIKNARQTAVNFGISEHTVRKWWQKYNKFGISGLQTILKPTISDNTEVWIRELYNKGLDSKQIQLELNKKFGVEIEISKLLRTLRKLSLPLPNPHRLKNLVVPWNKKINTKEEKIILKLHLKKLTNGQIADILEKKHKIKVTKVTIGNTIKRLI